MTANLRIVHAVFAAALVIVASIGTGLGAQAPPAAPSAESLLAAAMKQAQAENKNIFVDFGASWCGPCVALHAFLDAPAIKPIVTKYFVLVRLTVLERGTLARLNNPGAETLQAKWGGSGAVPFYVMLDANGQPMPGATRSGFGDVAEGAGAGFVALLERNSRGLTASDRSTLLHYFTIDNDRGWRSTSDRLIWTLSGRRLPVVSPNGRLAVYVDGLDLILRDLDTGADRWFATSAPGNPWVAFAPNSQSLAYVSRDASTGRVELRAQRIAPGSAAPRLLFTAADVVKIQPHSWSGDARWIAASIARQDAAHFEVGLIDMETHQFRLLEMQPDQPDAAFSSDGAFLALTRPDESGATDIWIRGVDSGEAMPAIVGPGFDGIVGWTPTGSPSGRQLLFTSTRGGRSALWAVPVSAQSVGTPEFVRTDVGRPLRYVSSGSLFYTRTNREHVDVRTVSVDAASGKLQPIADRTLPDFVGLDWLALAAWSPDERSIAYVSERRWSGSWRTLVIHDLEVARAREFKLGLTASEYLQGLAWSPDGRALVATVYWSAGLKDGSRFYLINASTGEQKPLAAVDGLMLSHPRLMTRDNLIYFDRPLGMESDETRIVERDLTSGDEREFFRARAQGFDPVVLSPDVRKVYYLRATSSDRNPSVDLVARDAVSGEERALVERQYLSQLRISPDGRHIVAQRKDDPGDKTYRFASIPTSGGPQRDLALSSGGFVAGWTTGAVLVKTTEQALWIAPVDGGPARRLDGVFGEVAASPDGRRLVFFSPATQRGDVDIWVTDLRAPSKGAR